jgi:hypothetical protein
LKPQALLLTVAALSAAPFLGRPLFVDDHAHFEQAEDMARRWGRPYRTEPGTLGWAKGAGPGEANGPLYIYVVGALIRLLGDSPWRIHLALWPLHALGLLSFYRLAERCRAPPLWASLAWLATPHFFVTSVALLADSLLAPLFLTGLVLWMDGWESGRVRSLVAGGVVLGLTPLVKYTGVLAWAVAAGWSLLHPPSKRGRWLYFLVPLGMGVVWEIVSRSLYGQGHFSAVAAGSFTWPRWDSLVTLFAFTVALTPVGAGLIYVSRREVTDPLGLWLWAWWGAGLAGLWVARGWVCARYFVVWGPAVILLVARGAQGHRMWPRVRVVLLGFSAALSAGLAVGDLLLARVSPRFVEEISAAHAGKTIFYPAAMPTALGYYGERRGWKGLAPGEPAPSGGVVVLPASLSRAFWPGVEAVGEVKTVSYSGFWPFRTWWQRAGFYGSIWGPNPFGVSLRPLEIFYIVQTKDKP